MENLYNCTVTTQELIEFVGDDLSLSEVFKTLTQIPRRRKWPLGFTARG